MGSPPGRQFRGNLPVMSSSLLVVHVHCRVLADQVAAFRGGTLANARASVEEPGVARFGVIQDRHDPRSFLLCDGSRTADAPAQHKATAPSQRWPDTVASMMAAPRTSQKLVNLFPDDDSW